MQNEKVYLDVSLRKIAKGAGFILAGTLIGRAFGYGSRLVIARLGASEYGLVSLGFAVMSILAILSLMGMQSGLVRYISFYKGKGDEGRIKGTIFSALKISLPLSVTFAVLLFWYAPWISLHIFHDSALTPILKIFSFGLPFWVLTSVLLSATVGFQDMRYNVYTHQFFHEPVKLLAIAVFLLLGFGVLGASLGWVLAIMAMPILAFYFLQQKVFPIFKTKVKAISGDKELFAFSLPLLFAGIAGLVMGWTDTVMLGYYLSSKDVGIYNAALPTAQLIRSIPVAFASIFFPVISELYARDKIDELRRAYSVVTKWMFALMFPVFLLILLFSELVITILFGAEYIAGATALSILVFGFMTSAVVGPASQTLQTFGRTKIVMLINYLGAAINVSLNFLLIPILGMDGAAIATGISLGFAYILNFLFAYRIAKVQPFRLNHLKIILASLTAVFVVYLLTKYVTGISVFALIAMLSLYFLLYFLFLLFMKSFEEEDLMIMRTIDQRTGTRSDWIRKVLKRFL